MRTPGLKARWSGGRRASRPSPTDAISWSSRAISSASCTGHRSCRLGTKSVRPHRRVCRPHRALRKWSSAVGSRAAPRPDDDPAGGSGSEPAQAGLVRVHVTVAVMAHPCPPVGHTQRATGTHDDGCAVGVEAEEDDPAPARLVDGVEPHVGLEERSQPRDCRPAAQPGIDHPERDQPDVGPSVERVGSDARRHPVRHHGRLDRPVQERQVAPALGHRDGPRDGRCVRRHGLDAGFLHVSLVSSPTDRPAQSGERPTVERSVSSMSPPSSRVDPCDRSHDLGTGTAQVVRRLRGRQGHRRGGAPRRGVRLPRPQRRRQVEHDADDRRR